MIYYLAIVFFLSLDTEPQLLAGPLRKEECLMAAEKHNQTNKVIRGKEARALGAEFVCLKVDRVVI